jgi:hypothetical protein
MKSNAAPSAIAGHDQSVINWACLASLIETAKLHGDLALWFMNAD